MLTKHKNTKFYFYLHIFYRTHLILLAIFMFKGEYRLHMKELAKPFESMYWRIGRILGLKASASYILLLL